MTKTLISIIVIALTFAGIPAQAGVMAEDHGCCESQQFLMAESPHDMAMSMMNTHTSSDIKRTFVSEHMAAPKQFMPQASVKHSQAEIGSGISFENADSGCAGCDSLLSCFTIDSTAFVSNSPQKTYTTYLVSETVMPSTTQFINIESPPEIRPPIA